jgi:dipeptidase
MCDTFIALHHTTADGSVIFGKNSDREANEEQIIEYHPPREYPKNSTLKCTYIKIPQVEQTYGVIISRPFWMWGAEMGVNTKGVVIGNEAVFTKLKVSKEGVLTGMDLLRLALERSDSAKAAKQIIIDLLQKHGQGGLCGYEDKNFKYHNSFLIADKKEAWVLETAGKYWAAKKIENYYAISNGLTIGSDYDEIHSGAIAFARQKKWVKGKFDFSSAFSDLLYTKFSACKIRRSRAVEILNNDQNKTSISAAMNHLRDHNNLNFNPSKPLLSNTICAHAGNSLTRNASQTTSSMIVHLEDKNPTIWITATSAACISIFKPVWFVGQVIPDLDNQTVTGNKNSFWWKHEILHRKIIKDYREKSKFIQKESRNLEEKLLKKVYDEDCKSYEVTDFAFKKNIEMLNKWISGIEKIQVKTPPNIFYKMYWKKLNKRAKLQI